MKKFCLLLLSFICLGNIVFADSPCDSETMYKKQQMPCSKSCQKQMEYYNKQYVYPQTCQKQVKKYPKQYVMPKPCEKTCLAPVVDDCFLCTNKNTNTLFKQMGLSETQICTAMKIQDKYALEVLSLNERIQCENQNLYSLRQKCAKNSEIRKQKRLIKRLNKDVKKICKNYECQFKAILSDDQKKAYKKYKKCK